MARIRVAIAQCNVVVGDLDGNVARLTASVAEAEAAGADLVAFPELAVTGYPPEDLLLKPSFVEANEAALERVAAATGRCAALVGFVRRAGDELYNSVAVCADGRVLGTYDKRRLPNYAVFDEQRYFNNGSAPLRLYRIAGLLVGPSICEDAWVADGPIADLAAGGAELIVNLNASPYHAGKVDDREAMLRERADEAGCPIVYANQIGGQDELVFDGASLVVSATGEVLARAPQFGEALVVVDLEVASRPAVEGRHLHVVEVSEVTAADGPVLHPPLARRAGVDEEIYEALVLGTRDYVRKNGFTDVCIGLSGGIDSSLVACVAADAIGADHVHGVLMPSRYSSGHSVSDAEVLARNLGIEHRTIAIEAAHQALLGMLGPSFPEGASGLTEENLQPRIRGMLLMALSNQFGWLVLTTGNKSEMAVGYATLYGDMAGGYAVIKDVLKTRVFSVCADLNRRAGRELVPASVLTKPPSAELRPDQLDTDSLPPYDELDPILERYVEQDRTVGDLIAEGFDPDLVRRIARLVDLSEYKRRQAPPGPRVTTKAFGKDRRLPITNRFRG